MAKKRTSSKQHSARQRMKKVMAKAKQIYKKNPGKKWTTCVKMAWKSK